MYYDKDTLVMVNQSVNEFYTRSPFKINAFPQYIILSLDIASTFLKKLSPDFREFLIPAQVHVRIRLMFDGYPCNI